MRKISPIGALARGIAAGAAASLAQTLFFKSTRRIMPVAHPEVFAAPEREQERELMTATVARRLVHHFMQRGPIAPARLRRAGSVVHYSYGAAWGGLYALIRESVPRHGGIVGGLIYGAGVWMVSDNIILPSFRLTAWPHRYPVQNHAYALAAHLAYGTALWGAYEVERDLPFMAIAAVIAKGEVARVMRKRVARTEKVARRFVKDSVKAARRAPVIRDLTA